MRRPAADRLVRILLGYLMVAFGMFLGWRTLFDPSYMPWVRPRAPAGALTAEEFLKLSSTDLNAADRQQLMALPGVGEVLSRRIMDYREENGGFAAVEELVRVKGIGEKTLEKVRKYVYVA